VLRLALDADPDQPKSFDGRWFNFDQVHFGPRPVQTPFPLWVGGNGLSAQRRAARLGTGWHPLFPTPEAYRQGRQRIVELRGSADGFAFLYSCPETAVLHGRTTSEAATSHVYDTMLISSDFNYAPAPPVAPGGRPRFIGTAGEVASDVAAFVEAGVDHFLLQFWTTQPDMGVDDVLKRMEDFDAEVAARFR
jgi:alkanesulfonate monooxygenase SsuD/methylene tetrahydromethanopterin reductase-like flavin-dependent oxidoreductase (luciferase family)